MRITLLARVAPSSWPPPRARSVRSMPPAAFPRAGSRLPDHPVPPTTCTVHSTVGSLNSPLVGHPYVPQKYSDGFFTRARAGEHRRRSTGPA